MNNPEVPIEIAPAGMSVQVSREYFKWNPIETADGSELAKQIVLDDLTLNLLVPEQYRDMEQEILAAWREYFYFEKVEAENDYNELAGREERLDIQASCQEQKKREYSLPHEGFFKDGILYF